MTTARAEFEEYKRRLQDEARVEGRTDLLRENICKLCERMKIDLTAEREDQLRQLNEVGLQSIFDDLIERFLAHQAWP